MNEGKGFSGRSAELLYIGGSEICPSVDVKVEGKFWGQAPLRLYIYICIYV